MMTYDIYIIQFTEDLGNVSFDTSQKHMSPMTHVLSLVNKCFFIFCELMSSSGFSHA